MKRVLVFLLLFGSALAVVLWIERRPGPGAPPPEPPAPTAEPPEQGRALERGIAPGARLELRGFAPAQAGEQPVRFAMRAQDSALAEGGAWSLEGVEAELFDPADGARQVSLHATGGTARLREGGSPYEPSLEALELSEVSALVERGAPVLPLEVRAPQISMPLASRLLVAPREATIEGAALAAGGRDALLDLPRAQLEFRGGGSVRVRGAEGDEAELVSGGPLRLYRESPEAAARSPLFLSGTGGTRVTLAGESPAQMTASEVLLRADEPREGGGFVVRTLEMTGEVWWQTTGLRVAARHALAELDADGRPATARFDGLPSAELSLLDAEALASGAVAFGPGDVLRLAGEGTLEIARRGEREEVSLEGPATVVAPGADLRAGGDILGWRDARGRVGMSASGGVVLEGESSTLETAELEALLEPASTPGETVLRVETRGGARLVGTLAPDRAFTLTTPDRLVAERRGARWRVLEATNVVVNVDHPDGPFEARARRVTDLDVEQASFAAEGEVSFQGPQGSGSGERLRMEADRSLALEGVAGRPARFEGSPGWVEGLALEVREGRLSARGAVRTEVDASPESGPATRLALASDALDAEWELEGGALARLDLRALGSVEARGLETGRDALIRSERFRLQQPAPGRDERPESALLSAQEDVRLSLREERGTLEIDGRSLEILRDDPERTLVAEGDVRVRAESGTRVEGTGERFAVDATGLGRLTPAPGGRVSLGGRLESGTFPFVIDAAEVQFEPGALVALDADVLLSARGGEKPVEIRARSRRMRAEPSSIELEGGVAIRGETPAGQPWSLEAERVWLEGELDSQERGTLSGLRAEGAVHFGLEGAADAYGDSLEGNPLGQLKLRGRPAAVETRIFRLEAEWIDFDPVLQMVVATGPGKIRPAQAELDAGEREWSLEYLAGRTLIEPDALVLALQEPELSVPSEDAHLRASWAVLWLDRHRWEHLPGERSGELPPQPPREQPPVQGPLAESFFGRFRSSDLGSILNEAYFEGPVELTQQGDLLLRAGAIYLDTLVGRGWISDATVNAPGRLIGRPSSDQLVVKAEWLRVGADGSLRADSATVTPCDFAVPHLRIVTGDLQIKPLPDGSNYELALSDNRIELFGLVKIPLPPIAVGTDDEYTPLWGTLRLANSARFGTLISAGIRRPAEGLNKTLNKALHGNPFESNAHYQADASWLGSRGVLLDLGLDAESKDRYWIDMALGGLPDRGRDRGYIRVDEKDRDLLRLWYRADGRWQPDEKNNVDLSVTVQTDPGVQSEFFESDFVRYERDETYLRWTRASNGTLVDLSAVPRLEGFRSQVEELPSLGLYGGLRPVARLAGVDVLYTGDTRAAYLRRRAGDNGVQSPFSTAPSLLGAPEGLPPSAGGAPGTQGVFADGLGERDVLRLDTEHRLEAPIPLGAGGARATPFVASRLTAWDEGADPDRAPGRWRTEAGVRLATTLWKRTGRGLSQLVPFVEARKELALEESGGEPVPFDGTEQPLDGDFVDLGLRGRLGIDEDRTRFDFELRDTWADGLADGREDGWQPAAVFARCEVTPFGHPIELWHDGRYDLSSGETVYSLLGVATRWSDDLRLEAAHHRGLDAQRNPYFEAATIRAIYTWTDKWEIEGRQTFSLLEDDPLNTDVVLRRYGHDIVVEIENSVREGEGTSFTINLKPRFGFRPARIGYLSY